MSEGGNKYFEMKENDVVSQQLPLLGKAPLFTVQMLIYLE